MNKLSRAVPPAVGPDGARLQPANPPKGEKGPLRFALVVVAIAVVGLGAALWPAGGTAQEVVLTDEEVQALTRPAPARTPARRPLALIDEPATIRVSTEAPGAEVWLDGEPAGSTPIAMRAVRPGLRTLRVVEDGRKLLDTLLYVARGATFDLHLTPPPLSPALTVAQPSLAARRSSGSGAATPKAPVEGPRVGWQEPAGTAVEAPRRVGW